MNLVDRYINAKQMTHDFNRNPDVFSPQSFREGVEFILESVEFIALLSAIAPFTENYQNAKKVLIGELGLDMKDFEDEKILKCNLDAFKDAFQTASTPQAVDIGDDNNGSFFETASTSVSGKK